MPTWNLTDFEIFCEVIWGACLKLFYMINDRLDRDIPLGSVYYVYVHPSLRGHWWNQNATREAFIPMQAVRMYDEYLL